METERKRSRGMRVEDLGSGSGTNMVAHNHLKLHFQGHGFLFQLLHTLGIHVVHIHVGETSYI